jgi:cyclophilin family peptidyl-prolyl cis-trans isomerase/HEAT repeat protein
VNRPGPARRLGRLAAIAAGALLTPLVTSRGAAQEQTAVEQLAPILAVEDARDFQPDVLRRGLVASDSLVRRTAVLAAGRIGDLQATPLIVPLLVDPDSTVRAAAAFALGLLRDSAAAGPLMDRLTGLPALDGTTAAEAVTALGKIGGRTVGEFFSGVLSGKVRLSQDDRRAAFAQVLTESWRLGADAPVTGLLPFTDDTNPATRLQAVYSLGRLQALEAANRLMLALRDEDGYIRSIAARALTRGYVDSAKVAASAAEELLVRAADDANPQVRINALRALESYRDSAASSRVIPLLDNSVVGVQVQAAEALGRSGGAEAARNLARVASGKGPLGLRRTALVALARIDTAAFARVAASWRGSTDWLERAAAAEGTVLAGPGPAPAFLADRDGRVIASGLQAWADKVDGPDPALLAAARPLLAHHDAGVRSVAADAVARAADPADLPSLVRMYNATGRDSFPDAALSALNAILAIRGSGAAAAARVDREFLANSARPANYLIRRWAEERWPEAAARWGPAYPITTGRSLQDYRDVVRRYLTVADSLAKPHVLIETVGKGTIEVELLGSDAPLTVDNFLRLVDRHFFDRNRWHRVVPNFVIQDGDPRGDGFGSPGGSIRDEINRNHYDAPMLGMALSGPDTGMSQWFINLSAQPHLDGIYTLFGRVLGGVATLSRITQGDVIRAIARK